MALLANHEKTFKFSASFAIASGLICIVSTIHANAQSDAAELATDSYGSSIGLTAPCIDDARDNFMESDEPKQITTVPASCDMVANLTDLAGMNGFLQVEDDRSTRHDPLLLFGIAAGLALSSGRSMLSKKTKLDYTK